MNSLRKYLGARIFGAAIAGVAGVPSLISGVQSQSIADLATGVGFIMLGAYWVMVPMLFPSPTNALFERAESAAVGSPHVRGALLVLGGSLVLVAHILRWIR